MKIVGHRGARGLAPENTLASLKKGLEHRADELEFDVRVTKDGVVILHHNPDLKDASGNKLSIKDHDLSELATHKPDLTTLQSVFENIDPKTHLYIEVKPGIEVQPVTELISKYLKKGWSEEVVALASKSQKTLVELHRALPQLPTVVIEPWSGVRARRRAKQVGTRRISMNQHWLWWGFIKPVSRRGWELYAYTLNNPAKAERWDRYGLTAVVTDYPDRFRHDKKR